MNRQGRRHRALLRTVASATVLGLAACSSAGEAVTTTGSLRGTAAATPGVRPPRAAVGDTLRATELAGRISGALRAAGTVRTRITTGGRTMTGQIDLRGATPAYRLTGGTGPDAVEIVYVDRVAYLGGARFAELAGGRRFLRVDPGGTSELSRMLAPLLQAMAQAVDPAAMLSALGSLEARATRVDGDATTWVTSLDADAQRRLTERLLGRPLPSQAVAQLRPATVEQTLDPDGRLLSARQVGGAEGATTQVDYSDYGAAVDIRAPAASDVAAAAV